MIYTPTWELVVCDLNGNALEDLTPVASQRALTFRMNGFDRCSFQVPADDGRVANLHTDGYPIVEAGLRVLKAYRRELQADLSTANVLRYLGLIWGTQDVGEPDEARTAVSCVSLLGRLSRRLALDAAAGTDVVARSAKVDFTNTDGAQILKTLVERTNAIAPTGITTAGGTFETTPQRTVSYSRRLVAECGIELASSFNGFDFALEPLDRTDGTLARLHCYARLGGTNDDGAFGWDIEPNNIVRVERLQNMEQFVTFLLGLGATAQAGGSLTAQASSASAIAQFGRFEAIDTFSDILTQSFLDALVADELAFRVLRRELVQFVPQPNPELGTTPRPWDDFGLGDLVPVAAGARLRGGFSGYQRIYGYDLVLDDDGREFVNGVYAAAENA